MRFRAALLLLIAGTSVQSLEAQTPRRPCSAPDAPAAEAGKAPVYRDCDVDKPANMRRDRAPNSVKFGDNHCAVAVIEFVVDTTGLVDTVTAAVVETDLPDYAIRLVKTLPQWRYAPAEFAGAKVRQVVRERRVLENPAEKKVPFTIGPLGSGMRGGPPGGPPGGRGPRESGCR